MNDIPTYGNFSKQSIFDRYQLIAKERLLTLNIFSNNEKSFSDICYI